MGVCPTICFVDLEQGGASRLWGVWLVVAGHGECLVCIFSSKPDLLPSLLQLVTILVIILMDRIFRCCTVVEDVHNNDGVLLAWSGAVCGQVWRNRNENQHHGSPKEKGGVAYSGLGLKVLFMSERSVEHKSKAVNLPVNLWSYCHKVPWSDRMNDVADTNNSTEFPLKDVWALT